MFGSDYSISSRLLFPLLVLFGLAVDVGLVSFYWEEGEALNNHTSHTRSHIHSHNHLHSYMYTNSNSHAHHYLHSHPHPPRTHKHMYKPANNIYIKNTYKTNSNSHLTWTHLT